jgi:hypothetical protein
MEEHAHGFRFEGAQLQELVVGRLRHAMLCGLSNMSAIVGVRKRAQASKEASN